MCGICGSTGDDRVAEVQAMCSALRHRGPDGGGTYVDPARAFALGARRLSIIDVEGGAQPLANEDGDVVAVLNGEIYNHRELRDRLRHQGHGFRTRTDTEVLVHLYEEYGADLVHALDGMFAFALWDRRRGLLVLGRDRFGEKPLFYAESAGELRFASELRPLVDAQPRRPEVVAEAVDAFFVLGYVPGGGSIVAGIDELAPGHTLTWDADRRRARLERYWSPPRPTPAEAEPIAELTAEARRLLEASMSGRLFADVPVGVFISGGVDSAVVAALAAQLSRDPIKTFTVGYDVGSVDEVLPAGRLAATLGADHHELILTEADVAARVPRLLRRLDQPLADQALVPLHAIAEVARGEVTVAVGGEGADEVFGGYPRYAWIREPGVLDGLPPLVRPAGALLGTLPAGRGQRLVNLLATGPLLDRHLDWVSGHRRQMRRWLYGGRLKPQALGDAALRSVEAAVGQLDGDTPAAATLMRLDQLQWLPHNVLAKSDRGTMLAGLEYRTPFLGRELAEFTASVRSATHLSGGGKRLLRELAGELLPGDTGGRRKRAFRVPAAHWLRGPLRATVEDQVRHGAAFEEEWFDRKRFRHIVAQHDRGLRDWSHVVWPVLAFGLWLDEHRGVG